MKTLIYLQMHGPPLVRVSKDVSLANIDDMSVNPEIMDSFDRIIVLHHDQPMDTWNNEQ